MCVCVHVCVCVFVCVCVHAHIYMCVFLYVHMYVQSLSEVTDTDALFALLSSLKMLILHGESLNYTINQYTEYITYTLRKSFIPRSVADCVMGQSKWSLLFHRAL